MPEMLPRAGLPIDAVRVQRLCQSSRGRLDGRFVIRLPDPRGGKSGLQKETVPGNTRAGQPDGKRHRNDTATPQVGKPKPRRGKGEKVG